MTDTIGPVWIALFLGDQEIESPEYQRQVAHLRLVSKGKFGVVYQCHHDLLPFDNLRLYTSDVPGVGKELLRYSTRQVYLLKQDDQVEISFTINNDQILQNEVDNFPTFESLEEQIRLWADRTFTKASVNSILNHLLEEVVELAGPDRVQSALDHWKEKGRTYEESDDNYRKESADVVILLIHLAHSVGFSLAATTRQKHAINRTRKFLPLDERGVSNHERSE